MKINKKDEGNGRLGLACVGEKFRMTLPQAVREFFDLKDDGTDYLLFYPTTVLSQQNNDETKGIIIHKLPKGMIKEQGGNEERGKA